MRVKMTVLVTVLTFGLYFNNIALGQWTSWSLCSAACGHGMRTRYYNFRTYTEECNNFCYNGGNLRFSRCDCPAGTTGTCCDDIPECASNPCQHGGTCIERINEYNCSCGSRYYGLHCENDLMWEHYSACQFEFNRCFQIFKRSFDWHGTQDFCKRRNGHLAVVDTPEKEYFLETALKTLEINEDSSDFWIGASSIGNMLQWITGGSVTNTRWPPDVSAGIHAYGCLALSPHYGFMWTELYCNSSAYYICEEGVNPIESALG